jgi:hypothetical protein
MEAGTLFQRIAVVRRADRCEAADVQESPKTAAVFRARFSEEAGSRLVPDVIFLLSLRPRHTGKMKDEVHSIQRTLPVQTTSEIALNDLGSETIERIRPRSVPNDASDFLTFFPEPPDEVSADEPCATRN